MIIKFLKKQLKPDGWALFGTYLGFAIGLSITSNAFALDKTVNTHAGLQKRIESLEAQCKATYKVNNIAGARLDELERKVAGIQKQITVLHAKKADK